MNFSVEKVKTMSGADTEKNYFIYIIYIYVYTYIHTHRYTNTHK